MAEQSSDVEVLVHVTAPSRSTDDAKYRQLARAYLAFQPHRRDNFASETVPGHLLSDNATIARAHAQHQHLHGAAEQPFGPESQELSFHGAIDNRSSPRLQTTSTPLPNTAPSIAKAHVGGTPSQSSWQPPPSEISDSYPLPRADINTTPTRIFQRHLRRNLSSSPSSSSSGKSRPPGQPNSSGVEVVDVPSSIPVPHIQQQQGSSKPKESGNIPPNVIPVTPLPPGGLHQRPLPVGGEDQDKDHADSFNVTHISSSFVSVPTSSSSPSRAGSELPLPPSKKAKRAIDASDNANHLARSSSDTGPIRSSDHSAIHRIADTLDIRPPSPPVGIDNLDPASLVSEKLDKLAHDLSSRYKPILKRPIDPFERGFWLVDCTSWTDATRLDTWVFLTNYLKSGLAGWGVWCSRDKPHDWIRFYCWGHVAKHVYLLMYLASGRQVKATGAKWFDAGGERVIDVLPAEKR